MPEKISTNIRPWYILLLSGLSWLASAGLGLYAVYSIYRLATMIYALTGKDYYTGVLVGQVVTVVAAIIWIVSIVASGEILLKHVGESRAWRLLGWIIGIELLLIGLGIFFG